MKHDGTWLYANPKHIEEVKRIWDIEECQAANTPGIKNKKDSNEDLEELSDEEAGMFRRSVGILLYIAHDRPDCQFSIGECSKYIKTPTVGALKKLKRLIRYLHGTANYGIWFGAKGDLEDIVCWTDADWAGDTETRYSTSGIIITVGGSMVFSSSRRQHARALSSGESEYYAATTGAADLLHLIEVMKFFGVDARGRLQTDSSACIGMASRKGVGRVRHLETRALWLQDVIDSERISIKKVPGEENLGDIGTKNLEYERHAYLTDAIGMHNMKESKVQRIGSSGGTGASSSTGNGGQHAAVLSALAVLFQALGVKGQRTGFHLDDLQLATMNGEKGDAGGGSALAILWLCLAVFVLGMVFENWLARRYYQMTAADKRTATTQSMTTYTWWWTENPRFVLQKNDGGLHV